MSMNERKSVIKKKKRLLFAKVKKKLFAIKYPVIFYYGRIVFTLCH